MRRIETESLETRYARHRSLAEQTRAWVTRRFGLYAEEKARSNTVTCVANTRAVDVTRLIAGLALRGYAISNGYGRLKDSTFRIGHMGDHTPDGLRDLLGAMDAVLEEGGA